MRNLVAVVVALSVVATAAGTGCKKEGGTAAGVLGAPCLPSGGCDRGLTCTSGKCEKSPPAKVDPAQIQAVVTAIDKRKATDAELQKKDVVAQPVKLLDQLKNVGVIWNAALLLVPDLKKYDGWVQQVLLAVTEIENLRVSFQTGGDKLTAVQTALDNVAKGSPQTMDDVQREVSAQVTQLFQTIDAATVKAQTQLQPVADVMVKIGALGSALCAVPLPDDAAEKRSPICTNFGSAATQAQEFLDMVLHLPFRSEVAALITDALAPFLDDATKQLLATPPAPAPVAPASPTPK